MISAMLNTIRETIWELNPERAAQLQRSGELQQMLDDYQDQITQARNEAAMAIQKQPTDQFSGCLDRLQKTEQAARGAGEVVMSQIIEEVNYLYR